jgi:hypothetical protein
MYGGVHWPNGRYDEEGNERKVTFADLPLYVASRTSIFLTPLESLSLIKAWDALASEDEDYIWRPLLKSIQAPLELWPPSRTSGRRDWIQAYRNARFKQFYVPNSEMTGSWIDDRRYWRRGEREEGSLCETVTRLEAVWWFNILGTWNAPRIGEYLCAIRVKFSSQHGRGHRHSIVGSWNRTLKFINETSSYENKIQDLPEERFNTSDPTKRGDGATWRYVYIGSIIANVLPATVEVGVFDHDSTFKTGLCVDCFRFFTPGEVIEALGITAAEFKARKYADVPTISASERRRQQVAAENATADEKRKNEEKEKKENESMTEEDATARNNQSCVSI